MGSGFTGGIMFQKKLISSVFLICLILLVATFPGCLEEENKNVENWFEHNFQMDYPSVLPDWNDGEYHGYYETRTLLNEFQIDFPDLVKISSIGQSVLARDIQYIRITNEKKTDQKYCCLIDGCIHGCEWEAGEACLYLAEYLLINFKKNQTIKYLLNSTEIFIIPMLNPDGRQIDLRFNENGIDLNRNFNIDFGRIRGGSVPLGKLFKRIEITHLEFPRIHKLLPNFPPFLTNCGRRPFSEPESKALETFSQQFKGKDFSFYLSCHTAGHCILGPWGAFQPPFHIPQSELSVFRTVEEWVTQNTEYTKYRSGQGIFYKGSNFYASGLSSDWFYKEFRKPCWTFEILSEEYEMWMGQGKHDHLVHWMKTTLPVFMYLLINIENLYHWQIPTSDPLLPSGVPPEPLNC